MRRRAFYDGRFYGWFLAPALAGLREVVAREVPPGGRVLDACSGTGDLALRAAAAAREVVAVELSPAMHAFAARRPHPPHVRFVRGDARTALAHEPDDAFDLATIVLALHEMPPPERAPVLRELHRLARRVLVVDFAAPMPRNWKGLRNRAAERLAGRAHHAGFRDWTATGGLPALATRAGLSARPLRTLDGGTLLLAEVGP